MKRLMGIFAHPDDETFGVGGTLASLSDEEVEITLVVATRGEEGEIASPKLARPSTLGEVRQGELECAAEDLGVGRLCLLGYRDSGMAGTPANNHPDAFIRAPEEQVVGELVRLIRLHRPHVLITFEPNGGYGHPDHIAVHRFARDAFYKANDPSFMESQGDVWGVSRMYYTGIPRSLFQEMRARMREQGIDPSELDWLDGDGDCWSDEEVDLIIDVSKVVDEKWTALECHRTQFGPENLFNRLPVEISKSLMSKEYFALAWPEEIAHTAVSSLFDGLP